MASRALTLHTHTPTPQQVLHGHQALIQPCCHTLTLACMLAGCQDTLTTWQDALHLVLLTSMLLLRHLIELTLLLHPSHLSLPMRGQLPPVHTPRQQHILLPVQTPMLRRPTTST